MPPTNADPAANAEPAAGPAAPLLAMLDAHFAVSRGEWSLTLDVAVRPGGVTALLGPNGAGKTTALQVLAGLRKVDRGRVVVAGSVVDEPATSTFVRPEERSVGVVFQDYLLFPRMSARDNVAFGLRARGVPRDAARRVADNWLDRMGLLTMAGRRPGQLSGGQAQRVALARALAIEPAVLLLDEPLAALDAATRMAVRGDLRKHLEGFAGATILVTHDPLDALVLADEIVVVEGGRVVQAGPPATIARHPRTNYIAQLVGLNLFRGRASGTIVTLHDGTTLTIADPSEGDVFVGVRPGAVAIYAEQPHGSPRNSWPAEVTGIEQQGHGVRVATAGPPDMIVDVTAEAVAELRLNVGSPVWLTVKATELVVYPAQVPSAALGRSDEN